jgi:hypothetical protein
MGASSGDGFDGVVAAMDSPSRCVPGGPENMVRPLWRYVNTGSARFPANSQVVTSQVHSAAATIAPRHERDARAYANTRSEQMTVHA